MANGRDVVRWTAVAFIIAGALLGFYGLMLTAYAPLAAAWWGYGFNIFWGGMAALVGGIVAALCGEYLMREERPIEEKKKTEITA